MITPLLAAQITWSGPRLAPEEAARILAASPAISNRTNAPPSVPPYGPRVVIVPSSATAGPFGEFPRYEGRPLNCCSVYVNGVPWFGPLPVLRPPWKGRTLR